MGCLADSKALAVSVVFTAKGNSPSSITGDAVFAQNSSTTYSVNSYKPAHFNRLRIVFFYIYRNINYHKLV